jgi:hypothetical protein
MQTTPTNKSYEFSELRPPRAFREWQFDRASNELRFAPHGVWEARIKLRQACCAWIFPLGVRESRAADASKAEGIAVFISLLPSRFWLCSGWRPPRREMARGLYPAASNYGRLPDVSCWPHLGVAAVGDEVSHSVLLLVTLMIGAQRQVSTFTSRQRLLTRAEFRSPSQCSPMSAHRRRWLLQNRLAFRFSYLPRALRSFRALPEIVGRR